MAKPQKQQNALRASKSTTTKSLAAKAPAAKLPAAKAPAAKVAARKLPPSKGRPVKLPALRAVAAKSPLAKPVAAPPPAKAPARKPEAPKPPVAKALAGKLPANRQGKERSAVEQSPATEAQIAEALTGKLSSRAAGTGFSWLGASSTPKPEAPRPVVAEVKTEVPEVAPEAPPPALAVVETITEEEEILIESAPLNEPAAAALQPVEPAQEASLMEPPATTEPVMAEPIVEEPGIPEPPAEVPEVAADDAVNSDPKVWAPLAAANGQSLGNMLKNARDRIGWALTVQAGVFVAFCILASKDAPRSGLLQFLRGGIPLFAMALICAGLISCHATQLMLDKLEAGRLHYQRLQQGLPGSGTAMPPDSLTKARWLAYWPSMIILGILLVVWLCIGLTVWFL